MRRRLARSLATTWHAHRGLRTATAATDMAPPPTTSRTRGSIGSGGAGTLVVPPASGASRPPHHLAAALAGHRARAASLARHGVVLARAGAPVAHWQPALARAAGQRRGRATAAAAVPASSSPSPASAALLDDDGTREPAAGRLVEFRRDGRTGMALLVEPDGKRNWVAVDER